MSPSQTPYAYSIALIGGLLLSCGGPEFEDMDYGDQQPGVHQRQPNVDRLTPGDIRVLLDEQHGGFVFDTLKFRFKFEVEAEIESVRGQLRQCEDPAATSEEPIDGAKHDDRPAGWDGEVMGIATACEDGPHAIANASKPEPTDADTVVGHTKPQKHPDTRPAHLCESGSMHGRWLPRGHGDQGIFYGAIRGPRFKHQGFVVGIYGRGKLRGLGTGIEGTPRFLISGRYTKSRFHAVLLGRYQRALGRVVGRLGPRHGFVGRWVRLCCNRPMPPKPPRPLPGPGTGCAYVGQQVSDGESFPSDDGCNTCHCQDGLVTCTRRACVGPDHPPTCEYQGNRLHEGEAMPSTDGCNSCSCSNGTMACTKRACPPDDGTTDDQK